MKLMTGNLAKCRGYFGLFPLRIDPLEVFILKNTLSSLCLNFNQEMQTATLIILQTAFATCALDQKIIHIVTSSKCSSKLSLAACWCFVSLTKQSQPPELLHHKCGFPDVLVASTFLCTELAMTSCENDLHFKNHMAVSNAQTMPINGPLQNQKEAGIAALFSCCSFGK